MKVGGDGCGIVLVAVARNQPGLGIKKVRCERQEFGHMCVCVRVCAPAAVAATGEA